MLKAVICIIGLLAYTEAFLIGSGSKWDDLKTTWGINPFSSVNYHSQPKTVTDALNDGFVKLSDCSTNPSFAGRRYVKNNDYSLVLMYDINGYISGMQVAVPKSLSNGYPHDSLKNHPFIAEGNKWFLTAYFTDPATICTTGRSASQYSSEGLGANLFIQNGTNPVTDSFKVPHSKADILRTKWTEGKCFVAMGDHFWYNIRADMSCDDFFPVFLLYNDDQLNAFGWALNAPFSSEHIEHPPKSALSAFFKSGEQPTCLAQQDTLSTLHIYLTSTPALDLC